MPKCGFALTQCLPGWLTTLRLAPLLRHAGMASDGFSYIQMVRTLRFLRVLRLLRMLKVDGVLSDLTDRIRSDYCLVMLGILRLIAFIMLTNHLIACLWYGIGTWDLAQKDTWVQAYGIMEDPFEYRYTATLQR